MVTNVCSLVGHRGTSFQFTAVFASLNYPKEQKLVMPSNAWLHQANMKWQMLKQVFIEKKGTVKCPSSVSRNRN